MKNVEQVIHAPAGHWVGDGFPVRSLISYNRDPAAISPFLLLDSAGPHVFDPNTGAPRGVGKHPHRGFETVTIVYEGEVSHRDSTGGGGTIGPGDVQWMTAGGGIIHEEYHAPGFTRAGGPFRMIQLWVNLPARDKMTAPGYQAIAADTIPVVEIADGKGSARIIAGELNGTRGPARTFTPVNLWDLRLNADAETVLALPEGHNAMIAVLSGHAEINGETSLGASELVRLSVEGSGARLRADGETMLLVMTGEPIDEPVVGHGPFVMNSEAEIRQAIDDFNSGRFVGAL